jgi:AmmeMemoRadiSam system protein A/AmmeMemoRadiSam system protein B
MKPEVEVSMKTNLMSGPDTEKVTDHPVGVACAVLMPHAPILVPEVGGERAGAAAASQRAMRAAAQCVLDQRPDAVVLISPHSPRKAGAFGLWSDDPLRGSFAQFNAPQVAVTLSLDQPLARAIATEMAARDLQTWAIHRSPLDHGALVPLWFLAEAGWTGPTVVLGLNYPGENGLATLGAAIAAAAQKMSRRIAVVASGDMSHRLTENAPCGFHPQARRFDEDFIRLVRAGDYRGLENIDPDLRELAAEDAVDSTVIAAAAADWENAGHQVLNYEGPFGVGYGVATLFAEKADSTAAETAQANRGKNDGTVLPDLARRSVSAALHGASVQPPSPVGEYLCGRRGVFVTVRHRDGTLRGCIGTIAPVCTNLVAETWRNARLAALQDHRFSLVKAEELADLWFEVSVLHPPEKISSEQKLDPQRYGVIVSASDGRRGLLLPGIAEIRTTEEQLRIAREKGWIGPDEPVTLQRFEVDHFEEPD